MNLLNKSNLLVSAMFCMALTSCSDSDDPTPDNNSGISTTGEEDYKYV